MLRLACAFLLLAACAAALTPSQLQRNATRPYWTSNVQMPACGSVLAAYNNVPARSNGPDQGGPDGCAGQCTNGLCYECVELTQRYFDVVYGQTADWGCGNANNLCNCHPSGVSTTSNPQPGDAVVFNFGTYGHTGIITGVSGGQLKVLEQNASPNGIGVYPINNSILCYLTGNGKK